MNKDILNKIKAAKTSNSLDLSNTKIIPEIWEKIFELTNLKILYLYNCNLSTLPDNISSLKKLERINLNSNKFIDFPKQLLKLSNLIEINIGEISNIPPEISNLEKLERFNFYYEKTNILEFGYNIYSEQILLISHSFNNLYLGSKYDFLNLDEINIDKINFNIIYRKKIIFLLEKNNFVIIRLYIDIKKNIISVDIYVFGKKENRKEILLKIRNHINKKIKNKINDLYKDYEESIYPSVSRIFYYPVNNENEYIDYDKLLELKQSGDNVYTEDNFNIPVTDLIDYIGIEDEPVIENWKGTNYITNVKIQNFKILKDTEIKLSENINIILGNNGLGKTSILQAITLGLLPKVYVEEYSRKFPAYITQGTERSEIQINWGENEYRKLWVFQRGLPREERPVNIPHSLLLSYGVNLNTNKEQDHTRIVNKLINTDSEIHFTNSIFEESYKNMHDPLIILKQLDDKIKSPAKDNTSKEIILLNNLIIKTINNFLKLINKTEQIQIYYHKEEQTYYFKDFFDNNLKTEQLSEGYKDHILLITDIIIKILSVRNLLLGKNKEVEINEKIFEQTKGVILIDEFDRHLHPVWQRKLLFQFKKYFKKIQFILTTHNPFSLQSAVGATAHKMVKKEGQIKIKSSTIQAKNILSIIRQYYTKDFFDYETQEELNKFKKLVSKIYDEGEEISNEFIKITNELLSKHGEEIRSIVGTEIAQIEYITGKTIKL